MKKNILVLFLLILSLSAIRAQLLWKITGKGLKHPSYLFGTHNLISIQFLDSIPGLYKAFNESNVVVTEMALNNIDATVRIQKAAIMPKNIKIEDLLNKDEYKLVDTELKLVMKFGLKDVAIMNPSFLIKMYELEIFKKKTGFTDDNDSGSYFQLVAAEKGEKIVGLETVDQQIEALYGNGSFESRADKLVETIQHKDTILKQIISLNKLYKAGKIDEFFDLSKGENNLTEMASAEYAKLIDNRNTNWMTELPNMMEQSSCFITLDAIHLGGQNGIIKLLEKDGYKLKPVK